MEAEDLSEDAVELLKAPEKLPHIPSMAATAFQVARLWPSHQPQAFAQIRFAIASRDPIRMYPAYIAMSQFIKNPSPEAEVPREITELLLHGCEQRTQPGLNSTLNLLGDMVENGQLNIAELTGVRKEVHRLSKMLSDSSAGLEQLKSELDNDTLPEVRILND